MTKIGRSNEIHLTQYAISNTISLPESKSFIFDSTFKLKDLQ